MKLLLAAAWVTASLACAQVITTAAGTDFVFPGRPLPAIDAPVGEVSGVAVGGSGNIYFSDLDNRRVMKVDAHGTLTIAAGNGFEDFSGDGGPATSAALNLVSLPYLGPGPIQGPAVDAAGSVFITDSFTNRIRKVTPNGIIATVAGNGKDGFSGDGGPATSASLSNPSGLAVDTAGNLFIADSYNLRIRKVTPDGIITTVAGNGKGGFSGDGGPATSVVSSK